MNSETKNLVRLSADLLNASPAAFGELLAKRRAALEKLAALPASGRDVEALAEALRDGRDARSRLMVERGALRAKIDDLRRLRGGLGQLRPIDAQAPTLDIRL